LALLGIPVVVSWFRSKSNTPSQQSVKPVQAQDDTDRNRHIGKNESGVTAGVVTITETPEAKAKRKHSQKRRQAIQRFRKAGGAWLSVGTFIVLVAYATITKNQWQTLIQSNTLTQKSLNISQRAYVTIGRPDGIVAEILWPKEGTGNAGLLVYYQNNGRLPARFNWGADSTIVAVVPTDSTITAYNTWKNGAQQTQLPTNHLFQPMYRARKGTQMAWSGTIDIGGGSAYQGILWEVPKERMVQLINFENFSPVAAHWQI